MVEMRSLFLLLAFLLSNFVVIWSVGIIGEPLDQFNLLTLTPLDEEIDDRRNPLQTESVQYIVNMLDIWSFILAIINMIITYEKYVSACKNLSTYES